MAKAMHVRHNDCLYSPREYLSERLFPVELSKSLLCRLCTDFAVLTYYIPSANDGSPNLVLESDIQKHKAK